MKIERRGQESPIPHRQQLSCQTLGVFLKDALPALRPLFQASRLAAFGAAGAAGAGILLGALQASFVQSTSRMFGLRSALIFAPDSVDWTARAYAWPPAWSGAAA